MLVCTKKMWVWGETFEPTFSMDLKLRKQYERRLIQSQKIQSLQDQSLQHITPFCSRLLGRPFELLDDHKPGPYGPHLWGEKVKLVTHYRTFPRADRRREQGEGRRKVKGRFEKNTILLRAFAGARHRSHTL